MVCMCVYFFTLLHLYPRGKRQKGKRQPIRNGEAAELILDCHFWTSCVRKLLFSYFFKWRLGFSGIQKGKHNLNWVSKLKTEEKKIYLPCWQFYSHHTKKSAKKMQGHTLTPAKAKPIFPSGFY